MRKPKGLLLDFGGVVVTTKKRPYWHAEMRDRLLTMISESGLSQAAIGSEEIERDLVNASKAASFWKNSMSRPYSPRELTYEEFWLDLVAADWSEEIRRLLRINARELSRSLGEFREARSVREGIPEVLRFARMNSVSVGIVSNSLMGDVHRTFLSENGLDGFFHCQIYSDEVWLRKPNPEMIRLGATGIGVSVEDCWYVGDNFDRDVLCAGRARVGGNILMEAEGTYDVPFNLAVEPCTTVPDAWGLLEHLKRSFCG